MKIILVANSAYKLVNFRLNLLVTLINKGYKITAVVPWDSYVEDLNNIGINVVITNRNLSYKKPFSYFKFTWILISTIIKEKPNFILSFTIVPNLISGFLARVLKVNFIPNVTGRGPGFSGANILAKFRIKILVYLHTFCFRPARTVFVQNEDDKSFFIEHKIVESDRCTVLPGSGVDLKKFSKIEVEKDLDFGFVGRVMAAKGILDFLMALKGLKKRGFLVKAVVVGGFPDDTNLKFKNKIVDLMAELGVQYLGHQRNVIPVLSRLKWLVLPSYYNEGTPRSLLEGASMGIGILTTNRPGCKDVVIEGLNGFLFEPQDHNHLMEVMLNVLDFKKEVIESFGINSRQLAERKFNDQIIEKQYLHFLCEGKV